MHTLSSHTVSQRETIGGANIVDSKKGSSLKSLVAGWQTVSVPGCKECTGGKVAPYRCHVAGKHGYSAAFMRRNWRGLTPVPARKIRLKWVRLLRPQAKQTSVMLISVSVNKRFASSTRSVCT